MNMDEHWMQLAIDQAQMCLIGVPKVGAVIVKGGQLLGSGFRDKGGSGVHAEHSALNEASENGLDVKGSTVYTTLEPCAKLTGGRVACAQRLIDAKVGRVFIGTYDRNPSVYRKGWRAMKAARIELRDFTASFRDEAQELNSAFNNVFRSGVGQAGGAKFDYSQNGGRFEIFFDDSKSSSRTTRWTGRGSDSVYAYDGSSGDLALATYADDFSDIDDPDALDYESHSVPVGIKDIVVFRSSEAHVLVQVLAIEAGPDRGFENTSLKIRWEVRTRNAGDS